jgi:hypothetical protein
MQILGLEKVRIMRFSGRKERNGGAARSANLGGCKGRAANGGEGKSGRRGRRAKKRADDGIVLKKKKGKKESIVKKDSGYYWDKKHKILFY